MLRNENRRGRRILYQVRVLVRAGGRRHVSRAGNLSTTGMLIFPRCTLKVGETAWIEFPLLGRVAELEARVVRQAVEQALYACAVEFTKVPAEVRRDIQALVAQRKDTVAVSSTPRARAESPTVLALYQAALRQVKEEERDLDHPRPRRSAAC